MSTERATTATHPVNNSQINCMGTPDTTDLAPSTGERPRVTIIDFCKQLRFVRNPDGSCEPPTITNHREGSEFNPRIFDTDFY